MSSDQPTPSQIRFSAMNLLAMREHSVFELKTKLVQKFDNPEIVESVISRLVEQYLQSDARFAQAFITMRQRQGKGPVIIKMELQQRGVSREIIETYLSESDPVWTRLAQVARCKRFGAECQMAVKEKARQVRFLQGRGFGSRHIQQAFDFEDRDF